MTRAYGARAGAAKRNPKGYRADGSKKKRWSAEERAARGRKPRKGGGTRSHGDPTRTPQDRTTGAQDRGRSPYDRTPGAPHHKHGAPQRKHGAQSHPRGAAHTHQRGAQERQGRERARDGRRDLRGQRDVRGQRDLRGSRERRVRDERFEESPQTDTMEWAEAEEIEVDTSTVTGANGFARLGVPAELVAVLDSMGITDPFPIQKSAIPDALAGHDVLGRGRTGSGKTLGFSLPLLARLAGTVAPDGSRRRPQAVVLEPTRELAMQVADVLSPLARAMGMRALLVAGGMSYEPQRKALSRGVDVIIATPGRLIDLMEQEVADLSDVRVSVLDEADEMADMGFLPEVTRILDQTPTSGQRMLFSATLDKGVDGLVTRYMNDPKVHEVDSGRATVKTMDHHLVLVKPEHKAKVTAEIANRKGKTIVFARTQKGVDRISRQLREAGVMAGGLHGGLTQGARARVMKAFKDGTVPVLVATDVAARGIHVDDVGLVLQVDPPADARDYTHRAGRTARAGTDGVVVSLILPQQRRSTTRLVREAGVAAKPREAGVDEEWLYRATGARKPAADPIDPADYEALIAPPKGAGRRRRPHGGKGRGGPHGGRNRGGSHGGRRR